MSSHRDALAVKGNNAVHVVQLENRLCSATHFYTFFKWEVKAGTDHDHFEV